MIDTTKAIDSPRSTARSMISAAGVVGCTPSGGQIRSRTSRASGSTKPRSPVAASQASSRSRSRAIRSPCPGAAIRLSTSQESACES
ncbi:MAG: hypothetical protein EBZ59_03785 [Planctomycetia bacterium]|nr:hypothetical protein [Planctomycetia bacterium]